MDLSNDDLLALLARQSSHISRELQALLDAQSDGLTKALGGTPAPSEIDVSSNGTVNRIASRGSRKGKAPESLDGSPIAERSTSRRSSTASKESIYRDDPLGLATSPKAPFETGQSRLSNVSQVHSQSQSRLFRISGTPVPVRQPPPPKPPTLKQARPRISERLRELASVKGKESRVYTKGIEAARTAIEEVESTNEKRRGMETRITELESAALQRADDERRLASEERELEDEIAALERRLRDLKLELQLKREERQSLQSEREAEISSWKNALEELDKKISVNILSDTGRYAGGKEGKRQRNKQQRRAEPDPAVDDQPSAVNVWALPASRRTLDMVVENFQSESRELGSKQRAAEDEGSACEEGAQIWDRVVERVTTLEARLKRDLKVFTQGAMSQQSQGLKVSRDLNFAEQDLDDPGNIMHSFLDEMDAVINELSQDLVYVDERGWNLLQCCVAAELEALCRGRELLGSTLIQSRIFTPEEMMSRSVAQSDRTIRAQAAASQSNSTMIGSSQHIGESSGSTHHLVDGDLIESQIFSPSEKTPMRSPIRGSFQSQSRSQTMGHSRRSSQKSQSSMMQEYHDDDDDEDDAVHDGPDPQLLFGGHDASIPLSSEDENSIQGPELLLG